MSYSFLTDVFPSWSHAAGGIDLHESFEAPPPPPKKPAADEDLMEPFGFPLENQRGPGPKAYDHDDGDYFKLLSEDWIKDTSRYQAQARSPFQPKQYAEEDPGPVPNNKGCNSVAKHLDDCAECRIKLEHIFRKLLLSKTPTTPPPSPPQTSMTDMMLLVGIGIFIIFLMDALIKLGKYLA